MAKITDNLTTFQTFLNVLSWKKIVQLVVLLVVIGAAGAAYELRESIYNYTNQTRLAKASPIVSKLSKQSQLELDEVEQKTDVIIAVQVMVVDFQKNSRTPIYTTTQSPGLLEMYTKYQKQAIADVPLFSDDTVNNNHYVQLINGEFICYPFNESTAYHLIPEMGKYIHSLCVIGIPPYYGGFSGAVVLYLNRQPTPDEISQLKNISVKLSTSIYERDFR